jgi:hypothetical protein
VDPDILHSAPDAPVSEWGVHVREEEKVADVMVLVVGVVVMEVVAVVVVVGMMIVVMMQGDDVRDGCERRQ